MDIASILNELWRRRIWVGVGIVVAGVLAMSVVFKLPSFEKKSTVTSAASTDVLVDTRTSALGSIAIDVDELTTRAAVYARMVGTTAVKERIAKLAGVPAEQIAVVNASPSTPVPSSPGAASPVTPPPPSPGGLRIVATSQEASPAIELQAQAPTPSAAERLADSAAKALIANVAETQERRSLPAAERVVLRQLGSPQAVVRIDEPGYTKAIAAFIGAFLAWCLLVLVVSRTAVALRQLRAADEVSAAENRNLVVGPWDPPPADWSFEELRTDEDLASPSQHTRP